MKKDVSLKKFNSWQVGGDAEYFVSPTSTEELISALASKNSYTILGGGTNVLISDLGIKGLVIHMGRFSKIEVIETPSEISFVCLAGTSKAELLKQLLKYKLEAALFIAGIPGTVGGGVAMNAGVGEQIAPREFVEIVEWIEVLQTPSLEIKRFQRESLTWDYRHCTGWQEGIITRVCIRLKNQPNDTLLDRVRAANRTRANKQPLELPSCGSVFRNPPGDKAGRLVEAAGLKAFIIGGAQVSEKHANFIVNTGPATASEISDVILHVQAEVMRQFAVALQTEVVWMGEFDSPAARRVK